MSVHARPASADFAVEIHVASDDERTSLHDAESHSESDSESDDRRMSQQRLLVQLPNGREPHSESRRRRWISEKDWIDYIRKDPLVRLRVVCIFRVPNAMKDAKTEAYVPRRVSLGPHHHRSAELPQMGRHKGRAMHRMMKRFNTDMDFADHAMEEIVKLEKEIRDSYEEKIDCDSVTLARMLFLDGCFILEVLTSNFEGLPEEWECHDPIFGINKLVFVARDILKDILKLENQVPFIVLRKLLELVVNPAVGTPNDVLLKLLENVLKYFNIETRSCPKPVHHLLGFLHIAIVDQGDAPPFNRGERVDQGDTPPLNRGERVDQGECSIFIKCCSMCTGMLPRDDIKSIPRIPCAVELRNAGIKFERCDGSIKEIKFDQDRATISLPPIFIQDSTEIVFRNLIAFEMCMPLEIKHVTCYVRLMDELINSQEDVALLRRMGVLTNHLGSDQEVADLFNGLCKEVAWSMKDSFDELREEVNSVNSRYKNKMKVQFAELVRDHFSSPWKALALAAAIVILLLTVVQTIFSII